MSECPRRTGARLYGDARTAANRSRAAGNYCEPALRLLAGAALSRLCSPSLRRSLDLLAPTRPRRPRRPRRAGCPRACTP